jgi:hypothetical protein
VHLAIVAWVSAAREEGGNSSETVYSPEKTKRKEKTRLPLAPGREMKREPARRAPLNERRREVIPISRLLRASRARQEVLEERDKEMSITFEGCLVESART